MFKNATQSGQESPVGVLLVGEITQKLCIADYEH